MPTVIVLVLCQASILHWRPSDKSLSFEAQPVALNLSPQEDPTRAKAAAKGEKLSETLPMPLSTLGFGNFVPSHFIHLVHLEGPLKSTKG